MELKKDIEARLLDNDQIGDDPAKLILDYDEIVLVGFTMVETYHTELEAVNRNVLKQKQANVPLTPRFNALKSDKFSRTAKAEKKKEIDAVLLDMRKWYNSTIEKIKEIDDSNDDALNGFRIELVEKKESYDQKMEAINMMLVYLSDDFKKSFNIERVGGRSIHNKKKQDQIKNIQKSNTGGDTGRSEGPNYNAEDDLEYENRMRLLDLKEKSEIIKQKQREFINTKEEIKQNIDYAGNKLKA